MLMYSLSKNIISLWMIGLFMGEDLLVKEREVGTILVRVFRCPVCSKVLTCREFAPLWHSQSMHVPEYHECFKKQNGIDRYIIPAIPGFPLARVGTLLSKADSYRQVYFCCPGRDCGCRGLAYRLAE